VFTPATINISPQRSRRAQKKENNFQNSNDKFQIDKVDAQENTKDRIATDDTERANKNCQEEYRTNLEIRSTCLILRDGKPFTQRRKEKCNLFQQAGVYAGNHKHLTTEITESTVKKEYNDE